MSSGKDDFTERYGGMRFGETDKQLKERMAEIDETMTRLKNGFVYGDDGDPLTHRLLELKNVSSDDEFEA